MNVRENTDYRFLDSRKQHTLTRKEVVRVGRAGGGRTSAVWESRKGQGHFQPFWHLGLPPESNPETPCQLPQVITSTGHPNGDHLWPRCGHL